MQQWEYLFATGECRGGSQSRWQDYRPRFINGKELIHWRDKNVFEFIQEMGQEGWELTSLAVAPGDWNALMVFKRPLS